LAAPSKRYGLARGEKGKLDIVSLSLFISIAAIPDTREVCTGWLLGGKAIHEREELSDMFEVLHLKCIHLVQNDNFDRREEIKVTVTFSVERNNER
jgi:hypothetical protein